jgi:hypothetical protein
VIDQPLAGRLYTGFAPAVEDSLAGHHSAPHLVAGERQIVCSVEGDQVLVTCDGVELFQWRGEPDALPVPTGPPEGKKVERAASSPPLVFPFALKLVRVYRIDAPPVPTPPTGPVDLLAAVDLSRDRAIGIASDNGDRLTIVGRTPTIVKLRRDVPVAFLLDLRLTRSNVTDPSVMIGILVGDRSGSLVIDSATSERQPASGLALIDGRRPNHETNATSVIGKRLLTDDQPSNVQVLVEGKRADGKCRVAASIDGVKFLDFLDDPARLTPFLQFDRFLRGEKCLWIGCWNSTVVFERIVLTPLDDASPDAVPLALREGQTPVDPGTVAGGPTTPERPALAAVPDAEALAAARKQVVDAFGRARTEAANREAKQSLVRQLIETAAAESDPVKDYALLDEALSVGIEIEDPALVLETVDARAARFEIEPWNQKGESLATILKSKSSLRRDLAVGAGLEVVEGALEAGEYEAAGELADDLLAAAVAAKQFALRKHIAALQQRIDAGRRLEAAANTARETLAANPDDAAACGVLGRWLCVGEGKWDEGLPLLAKSDDQTYRPLAEQELALADDADAEAQVKVAHAWWAMAENQTDATVKAALQSHAVERYRSVLPKIQSPLTRRTVEDRLKLYNLPTAAAGDGDEVILTPWLLRDALLVYTFERGTVVAGADKKWHVADLSGHAHHGTMEGGKQLRTIQGKAGLATFFEGRDDYILPSGLRARMVGLKQLTLAAWFNPAKTDGLTFLFDVGEGGRAARLFLQEGKLGFALPNVRGDARVDAPAPATGVWHHVAAVWDGGEQRLFLDGQLVASGPTTLAALDDTSLASEEAHWGAQARNFFRGDKCYVGVMDEMVVLPRALSEQEVRKLHRAGEAGVGLPALVEK